ncbi:MAG: hypothetical protein M1812_001389 [Candelaria pacifica]|nr:MAG: hypothetical protein M1812_001389 [Candelaria pacifica]
MTSHQLVIAKASFAAGLRRPDPTSIPQEEITRFHGLLDAAILQCSPSNVQNCKAWLFRNTLPSPARITALGKYLANLSASFILPTGKEGHPVADFVRTSCKRKRLHILYLLNDLIHHAKYHNGASTTYASLTSKLQPHLVELISSVASYEFDTCPKHHKKIGELLDIWDDNGYYARQYIDKLRGSAENAAGVTVAENEHTEDFILKSGKDGAKKIVPFIMPATHGDVSTPYYDLPAGNMMPHIIPNSSTPINPQLVKPLQFVAGPADESLIAAVKDFFRDVQRVLDSSNDVDEKIFMDIDALGQPVIKDEITGEVLGGEGYYGWSKNFCAKMKRRSNGPVPKDNGVRGRRDSSSCGASPRKRRRYSYSEGSGRSRSRDRSRSYSRSDRARAHSRGRHDSYSSSRSRSRGTRSKSPRYRRFSHSRSRTRTRSLSSAGRSPFRQDDLPKSLEQSSKTAQTVGPTAVQNPTPPPPFPANFPQGFPFGPGGLPIPPPPPPPAGGGQWPIPPPILSNNQFVPFPGLVPPPPPPPSGPRGYSNTGGPSPPPIGPRGFSGSGHSPPLPPTGHWAHQQQQQQQQQQGAQNIHGYGVPPPPLPPPFFQQGPRHTSTGSSNGRGTGFNPREGWRS